MDVWVWVTSTWAGTGLRGREELVEENIISIGSGKNEADWGGVGELELEFIWKMQIRLEIVIKLIN